MRQVLAIVLISITPLAAHAAGASGTCPVSPDSSIAPIAEAVAGASQVGQAEQAQQAAPASAKSKAAQLAAAIRAAAKPVDYISESDAHAILIKSTATGSGKITPDEIRAAFTQLHDKKMRGSTVWYSADPSYMGLAGRTPETRSATEFFADLGQAADPNDPDSVANAAAWKNLGDVLSSNLTNLTVIRFDEVAPPESAITASTFIVGRDAAGHVVGVLTAAVET